MKSQHKRVRTGPVLPLQIDALDCLSASVVSVPIWFCQPGAELAAARLKVRSKHAVTEFQVESITFNLQLSKVATLQFHRAGSAVLRVS